MADDTKFYADPKKDPGKNDDAQPSVTTVEQVLAQADERAGRPEASVAIPAPADAIDLAYRTAIADVDAQEVGKEVAAKAEAGEDPQEIDVEAMGEGRASKTRSTKTSKG